MPVSTRNAFIVSYDISDPRRLRQVFKIMRGSGDHLQLSVFRCELNPSEVVRLKDRLGEVIRHDEDQVLFADLGPVDGRGAKCIRAIGRAYTHPERHAVVV